MAGDDPLRTRFLRRSTRHGGAAGWRCGTDRTAVLVQAVTRVGAGTLTARVLTDLGWAWTPSIRGRDGLLDPREHGRTAPAQPIR